MHCAELSSYTRLWEKLCFQRVGYYFNWNLGRNGEREENLSAYCLCPTPYHSPVNTDIAIFNFFIRKAALKPSQYFPEETSHFWSTQKTSDEKNQTKHLVKAPVKPGSLLPFPQQGFFCGHEVMKSHCKLHFPRRARASCHSPQSGQAWQGDALPCTSLGQPQILPWGNLGKSYQGRSAQDFLVSAAGMGLCPFFQLPLNPNWCRWKSSLFNFSFPYQMAQLSVALHI